MLWKTSVTTIPEAEEAVTELLAVALATPASSYTDLETGRVTVTVYVKRLVQARRQIRLLLKAGLERIRKCGLKTGLEGITISRVRREDYAQSWKRHFPPLVIDHDLLVRPSWSQRRPRKGQALVVLDPGLSFGTGQHPTTSFCLAQIAAAHRRKTSRPQSFLDMGTGSGILAIAAAKLGFSPISAFDFDPVAVHVAQANARRNRVAPRIRFSRQDLSKLPRDSHRKFDLVCANILANVLIEHRDRILARLAPQGRLVLAGILRTEFEQVQRHYEQAGLRLTGRRAVKEWCSGSFARQVPRSAASGPQSPPPNRLRSRH